MSEVTQQQKKYFYFITLLRAFAAIIITNAHYTGIYPSDIIANGGLLGDVIFFSVSGFCLANPRMPFGRWYAKRLWRIYAVVWVITIVYVLLGAYEVNSLTDGLKWFVHPTKYHFVASITLLYIPLYFVARYVKLSCKNYAALGIGLFVAQMLVYLTIYDASYYHIDKLREPMIEFLFFQSMLLGLFFRQECESGALDQKKSSWGARICSLGSVDSRSWRILCLQNGVCEKTFSFRNADSESGNSVCSIVLPVPSYIYAGRKA